MNKNLKALNLKELKRQVPIQKAPLKIRQFDLSRIREQELEFQSLVDSMDSDQSINSSINRSYIFHSNRSLSKKKETNSLYGLSKLLPKEQLHRGSQLYQIHQVIQQDKSNIEWLENCKNIEPPQAKCQFFNQKINDYLWEDVKVLDLQGDRFIVQKYPDGEIKSVERLSLQFLNQNQNLYNKNKNISQKRLLQKKMEHIQLNKIQKISSSDVSQFPLILRQKLYKKFFGSRIISQLLEEVSNDYILQMKKCLLGVKRQKQIIKSIDRYQFFTTNTKLLEKSLVTLKKSVLNSVQLINERIDNIKINFIKYITVPLPLKLNYSFNSKDVFNDLKNQRHFLLSDIEETLQKEHNFLVSNFEEYEGSSLQKILKKLDYISLNCFKKLIDKEYYDLHQYLLTFINNAEYSLLNKINTQTLIELEICINIKEKEKKGRASTNNLIITLSNPVIYIQYTCQQITDWLLQPFRDLIKFIKNFIKIEIELLPLLLQKKEYIQDIFDVEEQQIINIIQQQYEKCQIIVKELEQYKQYLTPLKNVEILEILGIDPKDRQITLINKQQVCDELDKLKLVEQKIEQFESNQKLGLFTVSLVQAKAIIIQRIKDQIGQITNKLIELIKVNVITIKQQFQEIQRKSSVLPNTEEKLADLKIMLGELNMEFARKRITISQLGQFMDILQYYFAPIEFSLVKEYFYLKYWPEDINLLIETNKGMIERQEKVFLKKLKEEKQQFQIQLYQIQEMFCVIKQFDNYDDVKTKLQAVENLSNQFDLAKETVISFNNREIMFGLQTSTYSQLDLLIQDFLPFKELWQLVHSFETEKDCWLFGSFKKLNSQDIAQSINEYINKTIKMTQNLKSEQAQKLLRGLRQAMEKAKDYIWVIEALVIEAFQKKPQLWRELFRECKIQNIDPKEDFPLQILINRGILNVKDKVLYVSLKSEKTWNLEKRLIDIQQKLFSIEIEVISYKDTYIFKNYDEIQQILDEQLNVLGILKLQPHIKGILGKANHLEYKTVLVQDTLEYGMKCQKHWIYLDPIFNSEDIKMKLKKETEQFKKVEITFKECMMQFHKISRLFDSVDSEKMKIDFSNNVLVLDQIQKSLTIYLEQKRLQFPRFYFVSDEELVEILAQTKEPEQIQKHIYKCFEAISKLRFDTILEQPLDTQSNKILIISGFYSQYNEYLALNNPINVVNKINKNNVELWLCELEDKMKETLSKATRLALKDLNVSKQEYITKWSSQSSLLCNQIKWTRNTETAIRQQLKLNLKIHVKQLINDLQETVVLVRSEQNQIQMATLESMVVIEVHQKDIVETLLRKNITDVNEFTWISQMRFYDEYNNNSFKVTVSMINSKLNYGFEYLGNLTRLVITNLTDRCQRTLLGALNMCYGGAPEGPAGTGKTETVKDLSKAIGMPCIVFNCSDGLNYIAMGKFFKGLAASGAWCCFDEFNRLDPEVLSVVSQQIYTIQQAVKEKCSNFLFEGVQTNLKLSVAINITMNPGYTGRSELPDNLQVLFRPCAMIVPDYGMIAEIYLYSIGFEKARELSQKIVTCLRLCNEQLSNQLHYDFGMRALKSILNTAKRTIEGSEDEICMNAIISVNKPKLIERDVQLFIDITHDLFPEIQTTKQNQIEDYISALYDLNYQHDEQFCNQLNYINQNVLIRNGIMCIGESCSGKSACIEVLARALNAQIYKINPKAINSDQLYGKLDPDTKQWSDGVAPILIRDNISKLNKIWIQFDGPVDSLWIENLNTVLDDNKKLCLTSGEILKIPSKMCMMFEVENLKAASPATVSRCGMIYFQQMQWHLIVASFQLEGKFDLDYLIRRMRFLIDHLFYHIKQNNIQTQIDDPILVKQYLQLVKNIIKEELDYEIQSCILVYSLAWVFGYSIEENKRYKICNFLWQILEGKKLQQVMSESQQLQNNQKKYQIRFDEDVKSLQFREDLLLNIDYFDYCFVNGQITKLNETQSISYNFSSFYSIFIHTKQTFAQMYLATLNIHLLLIGPTGTGKTHCLSKLAGFQVVCSGMTKANTMQRLIETKICKRRRKGYYYAEEGELTIFIDDMNMTLADNEGAQPALELLRQWMETGGWYDLENKEFKYMCDIRFLSSMQPRNQVSKRFLRHFQIMYIDEMNINSLTSMLQIFIKWLELPNDIIDQIITIYQKCQQKFLPTPQKSHYVYTVRDVFKVFLGLSKMMKVIKKQNNTLIWKLFYHECYRVFSDKLVDEIDLKIFSDIIKEPDTEYFFIDQEMNLKNIKDKIQQDLQKCASSLGLQDLILFTRAIHHIIRICRILQQTHGLLIGMGGSGRSSLTKLANFIIRGQKVIQIDSKQWDENLLSVLKEYGIEGKQGTLLFQDFLDGYMLEDVCNIITHGEVSHIFIAEERLKIQEELSYQQFITNLKTKLNIILLMQPTNMRLKLRLFPAIINNMTINWFMSWSDEALESTAKKFLEDQPLTKVAVNIHYNVCELNVRYKEELRRYFYITPTQYLQMLKIYQQIKQERIFQSRLQIDRMENGVQKILHAESEVDKIRNLLFQLRPQLEKATKDNLSLLKKIKKRQSEADAKRLICEQDEKICSQQREEANQLRNQCQTSLNNVIPLLSNATEALEKITREDMILLKSFIFPPPSAAIVMEGLCYAFEINVSSKNKDPPTTQDYWDYAKKNLLNDKLIKRIKNMKLDQIRAINITNIEKLEIFSQNPLFERDKVFKASTAAGNLSDWIRAVLSSYQAVEIIEPKKQQLKEAEITLKDAEEKLGIKQQVLDEILIELKRLSDEYTKAKSDKEIIEQKVENITLQLSRAEKLTVNLYDEKNRWKKQVDLKTIEQQFINGDSLLCAATIAYIGIFPMSYRENALQNWKFHLNQERVQYSSNFQLQTQLCSPQQINKWIHLHLPNEKLSIDNAIIMNKSSKWPLIIDPQMQANQWIRKMETQLLIFNNNQIPQLQFENAIQVGYAVLIENLGEEIDSLYVQLLQSGKKLGSVKFLDKLIDKSADFRIYLTTKLDNPHYQPQVCVMVTLLNFQATLEGLTDQMLNVVVKIDEPIKEEQRIKNMLEYVSNQTHLIKMEDQMLELLAQASSDLLENETLIEALQSTKNESHNIEMRLKKLETDSSVFKILRESYFKIAETVASLYFVIHYLASVEPTYLWSLDFFISLYSKAIKDSNKQKQIILEKFILILYQTINRSLLEKDKLIFRFLLCQCILKVPIDLVRSCVMGCQLTNTIIPIPNQLQWMNDKMWLALIDLQNQYCEFSILINSLSNNQVFWNNYYYSQYPLKIQIPNIGQFQQVMIIKIIRPELFIQAINEMVKSVLGIQFLENIPITIEQFYLESDNQSPLLCIATSGADPRTEIQNLSIKYEMGEKLNIISLGQGQSQIAQKLIQKSQNAGHWVLLQNCHLAASFMPELSKLLENKTNISQNFRLWLTTQPTNILPQNVIIKSIKLTHELPRGLKNNMLRTYLNQDSKLFDQQSEKQKDLFFSLSFLHGILLERKKYGPLGWNVGYNFTQHDLEISKLQLNYFIDQNIEIPWEALIHLIADNNYGGRVTDPIDQKLLSIYVKEFINKDIKEGYTLFKNYKIPQQMNLQGYIQYINSFSVNTDPPKLFGLHPNAEIYSSILETQNLSQTLLELLPKSLINKSINPDKQVKNKCQEILDQLPECYDNDQISLKFPINNNSLNTLLQQEVSKYNQLIKIIHLILSQLLQALDGFISMTEQLQQVYDQILNNKIPKEWLKVSYLSIKPLGLWFSDFLQRLKFITNWIENKEPNVFWIGGFFFIQGFLTAILQNHSRKYKLPIDQLSFNYELKNTNQNEGVFVNGLFIDGAQFDSQQMTLTDPEDNILFYPCPIIKFIPTNTLQKGKYYSCPLYITTQRKGTLASNGLSINFICKIKLPILNNKQIWSKRGVALITQPNQ